MTYAVSVHRSSFGGLDTRVLRKRTYERRFGCVHTVEAKSETRAREVAVSEHRGEEMFGQNVMAGRRRKLRADDPDGALYDLVMVGAWASCIRWASSEPDARAAFTRDTGSLEPDDGNSVSIAQFALDDVRRWLGFREDTTYLKTLPIERERIFARARR